MMGETIEGRRAQTREQGTVGRYLRRNWFWWAVTLGALTPLALLAWNMWTGTLGVDPVNTINNWTGRTAPVTSTVSRWS